MISLSDGQLRIMQIRVALFERHVSALNPRCCGSCAVGHGQACPVDPDVAFYRVCGHGADTQIRPVRDVWFVLLSN
jgi:hypothetical protein